MPNTNLSMKKPSVEDEGIFDRLNSAAGSSALPLQSRPIALVVLLEAKGGLAANEVATRCGVTRATMTSLIDGLERDGLARRTADGQDRRSVNIQLTEKGADLARSVFDEHAEWLASVFGGLDREQSELLTSMISLIWQKTDVGKLASAATTPDDETA
jgi:DNA-binding MarR family transcriptional regulator